MEQRLGFEIGYFENRRVKEEGDFTSDGVEREGIYEMNDARSLAACLGVEDVILEERRTRLRAQLLQMWTDRAKRSCGCG